MFLLFVLHSNKRPSRDLKADDLSKTSAGCVFYTSFMKESTGDGTGSHRTNRGCISSSSCIDRTFLQHTKRKKGKKHTKIITELFLHPAAPCCSSHCVFCQFAVVSCQKAGLRKDGSRLCFIDASERFSVR